MAKSKRKKRLDAKFKKKQNKSALARQHSHQKVEPSHSMEQKKQSFYEKYYKQLLIIPFLLLVISIAFLGVNYAQTGDVINRGIKLKGGSAITVTDDMTDISNVDLSSLESSILTTFPEGDLSTRVQKQLGVPTAITIELDVTEDGDVDDFKQAVLSELPELEESEINNNMLTTGSSLGQAFFKQIIIALLVAFVLMGIVVFIKFKVPAPSFAVILAAFSDIVVTLAVVTMMGMKLSSAGIAAFLMLIGYSVDTDILLSTRVLKRKKGTVYSRVISAMRTGLTMNITTLVAITIALFVSQSPTLTEIMTILFIGLIVDMINTWIQNAGILRWFLERKSSAKGGDN
ncbi:MAG: protein translocase subunit SecF [Nanobdellota archaeon]